MNDRQTLGEQFYQHLKPYYERAFNGEAIEAEVTNETDLDTSLHFSLAPLTNGNKTDYIVFHAFDTSATKSPFGF